MSEQKQQAAYFQWCAKSGIKELEQAFAVPNGGSRHMLEALNLKRSGVRPGVPDVLLPIAKGGFIGLALEFKWNYGKPSEAQIDRVTALQMAGWCVMLVWDWEAAKRATEGYLGCLEVVIR